MKTLLRIGVTLIAILSFIIPACQQTLTEPALILKNYLPNNIYHWKK